MSMLRLVAVMAACVLVRAGYAQDAPSAACDSIVPLVPGGLPIAAQATGASVGVLDAAAITSVAGRTLSDALAARIPGVTVMRSSGVSGTGSRIYMRGAGGIIVPQQPLLFIDGVRVDDELQSLAFSTGGQAPSRLDDVPLEQVSCVHVLRGPAATARYGTDAAGGVIHVTTRATARAGADSTRLRVFTDAGAAADVGRYPANYGTIGAVPNGQVRSWSPLQADSPFRTGLLAGVGGEAVAAFSNTVSAALRGQAMHVDGALRNNAQQRYALDATATVTPQPSVRLRSRLWFNETAVQLPFVGNYSRSVLSAALFGNSVDDSVRRGYREFPRFALQSYDIDQRARRVGGLIDARWAPRQWLTVGALLGREDSKVSDTDDRPIITAYPTGDVFLEPAVTIGTAQLRTQRNSISLSATATYGPPALGGATSISLHQFNDSWRAESRYFHVEQPDDLDSYEWRTRDSDRRAVVARQSFASSGRRFAEVGVRREDFYSIFGLNDETYAFANGAWNVSAESFYPRNPVVSSLRLRGAFGQSGDARPLDAALGLSQSGVIPGNFAGEPTVERSHETEAGVDLGVLRDQVSINGTWFQKRTSRALHTTPRAPGAGGALVSLTSTGEWETRGVEIEAKARVLDRASVQFDLGLTYATFRNEVLSLGQSPPLIGVDTRLVTGYPLHGYWARPFSYADANGDGVLVSSEVTASPDYVFVGSSTPTREWGVAPSVVFARAVTVSALLDYKGGFKQHNLTERLRCASVCAGRHVPGTTLADQARAVDPTDAGMAWFEDGDFVRLREVAVSWNVPPSFGRRIGAHTASLTLIGRNLALWTDYSGLDPEVSWYGQSAQLQQDLFTLPLARTLSVRLDVRW